ncbi:hypothetical protein RvY_02317-2 [Ramazzottius varieornatus]|uniref:Uncharacterized protein n=1 Tax=Ramazzottius varieornatus TaxID=947166 RepID=A0A1D1UTW3_RAMVA|nr:hypothetical protein RvY_02317-2 [Ramazzottius varieornatus]
MESILEDFNRKEHRRQDLKIVYVDQKQPDLQMEAFIKRNRGQVTFLLGTLLRMADLQRAKVQLAFACMFVANKGSDAPEREDSTTVMTVTSCKSFSPATRCIVQILQVKAKTLLLNIPTFSLKRGDNICCSQEIELGLLAQNCLAPGCGTLLMNLACCPATQAAFLNCSAYFPTSSAAETESSLYLRNASYTQRHQEMTQRYKQGCFTEIHVDSLSPYFLHMSYPEAAAFCKTKLDLLLIGLFKGQKDNKQHGMQICPAGMTVEDGWAGIFFAASERHIQRAKIYCPYCHDGILNPADLVQCRCEDLFGEDRTKVETGHRNPFLNLLSKTHSLEITKLRHATLIKQPPGFEKKILTHVKENFTPRYSPDQKNRFVHLRRSFRQDKRMEQLDEERVIVKVDVTGSYYWTNARAFQAATLTRSAAAERPFRNHIVILLMAEAESSGLLGLRELLLPMRCSRVPYEESREIVILGNPAVVEREWNQLWNLPKLTIVKGHPLCRADLRAISIRHCQMTLVLSSYSHMLQISSDPVLQDKAAILAALNVKALPFEDIALSQPASNTLEVPGAAPLGITTNLSPGKGPSPSSPHSTLNSTVPITVQLQHEMNGRLMMPTEFDTDPGKEEVLSEGGRIAVLPDLLREPFINAECITFGCVDNLLVQSVASPLAIAVLQHLICGFQSPGLDNLLAEGAGIIKGQDYSPETVNQNNVRIRLMAFEEGPWLPILHERYAQVCLVIKHICDCSSVRHMTSSKRTVQFLGSDIRGVLSSSNRMWVRLLGSSPCLLQCGELRTTSSAGESQ